MPLPIAEDLTRIPYRLYRDEALYAAEQRRLFGGPCWNFLCPEAELPNPGDFRSTFAGETPVAVTRGRDGALSAFENRCAHRGALICLEDRGNAKSFRCVYHAWTYSLCGDLVGVAFKNGIGGEGGMRPRFLLEEHDPRKLRVAAVWNLVGPGGYVSMEDDCVGGFVQRGIAGTGEESAVLEMGGDGTESRPSRVTEASIRGFWKAYRTVMGPAA
jgi:nitrite reductase/ring-hydroxylating ferredoxin subunit